MSKEVKVTDLKREYDYSFKPSQEFLNGMPDLQNSNFVGLPIEFVGIRNFHLPIRIREKGGGTQEVMVNVVGTCSVDSHTKGLNMSRIIRGWNPNKDDIYDIDKLETILRRYQEEQHSFDAHILMNFKYRIWQESLRSTHIEKCEDHQGYYDQEVKNGGWQYYNVTFDVNLDESGEFKKIIWVDFIYSSTCPCSTELSFYNMYERGHYGVPHSQRSIARIGIEAKDVVWIEDVVEYMRKCLTTETQVFVKREDEMAFAEKCGADQKFCEDAARRIADELNTHNEILDYKVIILHLESLHPFDAASVITKGIRKSIFNHHVTLGEWNDLAKSSC